MLTGIWAITEALSRKPTNLKVEVSVEDIKTVNHSKILIAI